MRMREAGGSNRAASAARNGSFTSRRWPMTETSMWRRLGRRDRKSTRLNSSHPSISYAVFCLKKKKKSNTESNTTKNKSQPFNVSQQILYLTTSLRYTHTPQLVQLTCVTTIELNKPLLPNIG